MAVTPKATWIEAEDKKIAAVAAAAKSPSLANVLELAKIHHENSFPQGGETAIEESDASEFLAGVVELSYRAWLANPTEFWNATEFGLRGRGKRSPYLHRNLMEASARVSILIDIMGEEAFRLPPDALSLGRLMIVHETLEGAVRPAMALLAHHASLITGGSTAIEDILLAKDGKLASFDDVRDSFQGAVAAAKKGGTTPPYLLAVNDLLTSTRHGKKTVPTPRVDLAVIRNAIAHHDYTILRDGTVHMREGYYSRTSPGMVDIQTPAQLHENVLLLRGVTALLLAWENTLPLFEQMDSAKATLP